MSQASSGLCALVLGIQRIVVGFLFTAHGTQKLFSFPVEPHGVIETFSQAWFGGVIELVGGLLIMLGLFTRPAAFVCSGMMAVAYFQFHHFGKPDASFWPSVLKTRQRTSPSCSRSTQIGLLSLSRHRCTAWLLSAQASL